MILDNDTQKDTHQNWTFTTKMSIFIRYYYGFRFQTRKRRSNVIEKSAK